MLQRILFGCLASVGLLLASGCTCMPSGVCGAPACGAPACGTEMSAGCGSCGNACDDQYVWQGINRTLTCGSGCGDIYWGEWSSDPPACNDPCDNCGSYTSGSCCGIWNPLAGLHALWGYRYTPGDCGGCATCGGAAVEMMPSYEMMPATTMGTKGKGPSNGPGLKAPPVPTPVPDSSASATSRTSTHRHTVRQAKYVPGGIRFAPKKSVR